jgi:protein-tyrosine kinase
MSIIELATKRLEEMTRAGVVVPWDAAGLAQSEVQARVESIRSHPSTDSIQVAPMRRFDGAPVSAGRASPKPLHTPANAEPSVAVTLDLERLERLGHVVPRQGRSTVGEEFRQIKRSLLKNARGKESAANRLSLIMVTSALPGEGKTFCALNLAMSMAVEIDMSVLLVDADVVRSELMRRLRIRARKGLLDLLTEPGLNLSDVVLRTNVPKLAVLPAGTRNNLSTELLASEAMEALLVSLATGYPDHVVIFDAPPLLMTSEAKLLASRVGQVVLVVEASNTQRSDVAQALAALEQCPNVTLALNKAHMPEVPRSYGDYYG